jgi:hypothetical protein
MTTQTDSGMTAERLAAYENLRACAAEYLVVRDPIQRKRLAAALAVLDRLDQEKP